ncbi:MAG TPA: DUF192 domain-containing protein [Candidatus Woesebacteria bacterium]|nr:DUF192 domain-containing protein [Candidatus Woesebacteria bacterium]
MPKIIFIGLLIFLALVIYPKKLKTTTLTIDHQNYQLEIAKSISQKTIGLMNRTQLCQNCGMVFIFDFPTIQSFWMKNTLIPLDMIFLDQDFVINTIHTAHPQPNTPDNQLKLYQSTKPSQYVIEINANQAKNLKIGDTLKLDL